LTVPLPRPNPWCGAVTLPEDLSAAVLSAYHLLGESVIVAVRSSGAGEDSADTSFAGMNATFTNVHGDAELLEECGELLGLALQCPGHLVRASRAVTPSPL